ncbi:hypothetical protein MUK70_27835 [Dyadobacter chenwenxiniae]|uniref:Uncharacterized protein n=1 Tax=Dyadobacter chenwenxiniae TaxID=2906456 RepID=A0A9X1TMZ3_9BACT|nr:hypothetical protein [Dyadobacter chenwenxiniae]MCF0064093.1 hypothetical protein [Dyadobacter chenwenxiniae]UON82821.1 hypothetical protein MUK70_27835 [Dyadobacter chenwenxiniae]
MQNEKLFDKIKQAALTETAGTAEYDPENIWSKIQNKDNRKSRVLWWLYMAASVVFILIFLVNLPEKQQKIRVANSKTRETTPQHNPAEHTRKEIDRPAISSKLPASEKSIARKAITEQRLSEAKQEPASIDMSITGLQIPESGLEEYQTAFRADSTTTPVNDKQDLQQKGEKVLIANIALPEQEIEQSGLQRIFNQVKKDREARRMRLQFNRNVGKLTLWSLVHQSFFEHPPAIKNPRQPQTIHH